jgi:hypothetical protein
MTLNITQAPTANAGSDEAVCQGDDVDLSNSATTPTASNFSNLLWSSSGDGNFDDQTALSPIYTPGAADIAAGSVTLTLTANSAGACVPASAAMTVTLTPSPTANAGSDEAVCQGTNLDLSTSTTAPTASNFSDLLWSSSGDGSFDDQTALMPIYTLGAADLAAGTVTLTLTANGGGSCGASSDAMTLNSTPNPTANAGTDESACQGAILDLSNSATQPTASDYSSLMWSTSGDGSFDDQTALTPMYTSGGADIVAGSVTLTLTANGNGSCTPASDAMTLTLTPGPTANAGSDEAVCQGANLDLSTSTTAPAASNFSNLLWSSSGSGTFSDAAALAPVYTPSAADISNGSITLTLTANGNGSCAASTDNMVLTLAEPPTASAGSDEAVCSTETLDLSASVSPPTASDFSSLSWTTSGSGAFNDINALTPIYTPSAADITNGSVILMLTANGNASCAPASDAMTLNITQAPTANAGSDEAVCQGDDVNLSNSATTPTASNFSDLLWSSSGDGNFDDQTALTPIYTPGAADIAAGSVTLTLTANSAGACAPASDAMTVTLTPSPTANAGSDEAVCQGANLDLSTSTTAPAASNFSDLLWSGSGDGSFDDQTALTPIYTPGVADIAGGSVTLTLTANGNGSCTPASDAMTLTITSGPTANAGSDEAVCQGDDVNLSNSATTPTASNFSDLLWSSSGDGNFDDQTALAPIYSPGGADIAAGSVTLTLTANSGGACAPASDAMTVTLTPSPTANAGSDEAVCQGANLDLSTSTTAPAASNFSDLLWSGSGDGSFDDQTALTPIYTPGVADIAGGSVTLTLTANGNGSCTPASDAMTLTITSDPTANAGSDEAVCQGDDVNLSNSATIPTASNFSDLLWSSSGDGNFDDQTALAPIYSPGGADIAAGSVTLTLTANSAGACAPASDAMTVTLTPSPTANAGSDEAVCQGANLDLSTSTTAPAASNFSDLLWSGSGDGSFDDQTALTPIYTPGVADIAGGSVTLTLTANGNGSCTPASDAMTLTITSGPTANAGSDEAVCQGDDVNLSNSATTPTASNFSDLLWSSSGDGNFDDQTALTPIYTPGAADIAAGSVTLTLTANSGGACAPASDAMTVTLTPSPTANAGSDEAVCQGANLDLSTSTTAPAASNFSDLLWSGSGDGSFDDQTALTPIYTPGVADIAGGSVTLTLTANGNGSCTPASDAMTLTITSDPTANAGSDEAVCQGDDVDLSNCHQRRPLMPGR